MVMVRVSGTGRLHTCNWRSAIRIAARPATISTPGSATSLPTDTACRRKPAGEWEKATGWDRFPVLTRHFRFGEHTDAAAGSTECPYLDSYDQPSELGTRVEDSGDPEGSRPGISIPGRRLLYVGYYDGSNHGGYQTQDAQSYYGCYDMSGNVWEWCYDWYDLGYYSSSPYDNPTGAASGTYRVLRGGSYLDYTDYCRAADRLWTSPGGPQPQLRRRRVSVCLGDSVMLCTF